MLYLKCRSSNEYLAAFADIAEIERELGAAVVPSFPPTESTPSCEYQPSSTFADISRFTEIELLEWCEAKTQDDDDGKPSCIIGTDDAFALYGAAYSIAVGKRVLLWRASQSLRQVTSRIGNSRSVTFILSPRKLAASSIDQLRDLVNAPVNVSGSSQSASDRSWGIITASSIASISRLVGRLIVRAPASNRRLQIVTRLSIDAPDSRDVDVICLPNHPDARRLADCASSSFVTFSGHGRSYCGLDGNLCSIDKFRPADDRRCVGGYECAFPGFDRVPVSDLPLDVVLIDSCSTANFQTLGPGQPVGTNLAIRMLDGQATCVLSPWRSSRSVAFAPYFAWRLAASGMPIGQVCLRLNRAISSSLLVPEPFLLLGDPEMQVYSPPYKQLGRVDATRLCENRWELSMSGPFDGVEVGECFDEELAAASTLAPMNCIGIIPGFAQPQIQCLPSASGKSPMYTIIIWTKCPESLTARLEVTNEPLFDDDTAEIARQLQAALPLSGPWTQLYSSNSTESAELDVAHLDQTLRAVDRLVATAGQCSPNSADYSSVLRAANSRVLLVCRHLNNNLIRRLINYARRDGPFMPLHEFREAMGVKYIRTEKIVTPCYRCGASVEKYSYRAGTWPGRLRYLLECERCLFFSDTETDGCPLYLEAPPTVALGSAVAARVSGQNHCTSPAVVDVAVVAGYGGVPASYFGVMPEIQSGIIAPNSTFCFNFDVSFSADLPAHLVYIHGLVVMNGRLSWAATQIEMRRPALADLPNGPD